MEERYREHKKGGEKDLLYLSIKNLNSLTSKVNLKQKGGKNHEKN